MSHPNILALHDFAREGNVAYAVMELLEGETLREALASGALSLRRATEYAVQIAHGLAAAHEKGIVHRDLKPDNVFVTQDERVKILDFGLAKSGAAATDARSETQSPTVSGYTEPGKVMGTVGYMSPEQVRGLVVDHRSDIFSFGSVLYEMVTGRRPFVRDTAAETMTAILKEDVAEQAVPRFDCARCSDIVSKKSRSAGSSRPEISPSLSRRRPLLRGRRLPSARRFGHAPPRNRWGWLRSWRVPSWRAISSIRGAAADVLPDWKDMTLTLLTTDPGYEGEPTFSPDGQTIAYVADRDGNFEIYLQQISGGPAINLTRDPAADIQPAFSPDGREIAFVSDRAGGAEIFHAAPALPRVGGDIWVMPTLGGPARRIVQDGDSPSWTPDGTGIVYVHGTFRNARIAVAPSTGGVGRDLPIDETFVARYFFPRLSQDGRWLLYQNGYQIEVVSAQGGKPKTLAQGEYPAWGAGSTSILYTNGQPGKSRTLWTAPFSPARGELSGSPRPLTFGRGADLGAAVSRDGKVIAFSAVNETLNLEEVSFDDDRGRVLGTERELTPGNNQIGFFDISPDGKATVYGAQRGAGSHLWRIDPPAPPVELTREPGFSDMSPTWSPDGRQIAFTRQPIGASGALWDLWMMNADGTSPRRVAEIQGAGAPVWMPNGAKMLIPHGDSLLELDLASGRTAPVPGADARTLFVVDRSGQWIVFQTSQGGPMTLSALPIAGGTPRVVVDKRYEAYHPFFSPSGRWLYFQQNHKNLLRVPGPAQDWKSAPPEKVTDFSGTDLYIEDPKLSKDGSKLFFTRGRTTGDIVILRQEEPTDRKPAR